MCQSDHTTHLYMCHDSGTISQPYGIDYTGPAITACYLK